MWEFSDTLGWWVSRVASRYMGGPGVCMRACVCTIWVCSMAGLVGDVIAIGRRGVVRASWGSAILGAKRSAQV
jgi:hypothetical protein